jgi:hypothetical protein
MTAVTATPPLSPPGTGAVLRRSVRDFYEESWRFVTLNVALGVYVVAVLAAATLFPPALVLILGAGPLAAVLVSAAVILVDTGSLTLAEVREAAGRCWRRGLVLGAGVAAGVALTVFALLFYGGAGPLAWPFAVLVLYLGGIFGLYQLLLWPLALRDSDRPLREVSAEAGLALVRRPFAALGLGLALLLVNLAGLVLGVLPLLTLTLAYSAIAAARFALPPSPIEEA